MMEFNDNKPIYRQIADYAYNAILSGQWEPEAIIPSVRELSAQLGVNSRTVLKAMEQLQNSGIITMRRGLGFQLSPDAPARVTQVRREEFFSQTLPAIADEMTRLGLTASDILPHLPG